MMKRLGRAGWAVLAVGLAITYAWELWARSYPPRLPPTEEEAAAGLRGRIDYGLEDRLTIWAVGGIASLGLAVGVSVALARKRDRRREAQNT